MGRIYQGVIQKIKKRKNKKKQKKENETCRFKGEKF